MFAVLCVVDVFGGVTKWLGNEEIRKLLVHEKNLNNRLLQVGLIFSKYIILGPHKPTKKNKKTE